jgi:hypothetical protein
MIQQYHYWVCIHRKGNQYVICHRDTLTPMFTGALYRKAFICNQPRCSLMDSLIKKMWYTDTMEYYSTIKRNKLLSFVTTWMSLSLEEMTWNKPHTKRKTNSTCCLSYVEVIIVYLLEAKSRTVTSGWKE